MLLLLLLEVLELAVHEVAVELAIGVIRPQLERSIVGLDCLRPILHGLVGSRALGLLSGSIQGVAEVVVGVLLLRQAFGIGRLRAADRCLECFGRPREFSRLIRCRAGVELQNRFGAVLCRRLIVAFRRSVIAATIGLLGARRRGVRGPLRQQQDHRQQRRRSRGDRLLNGPRRAPPVAYEQAGEQQGQCARQWPLVSFRVHPLFPRREVVLRQRRQGLLVNGGKSLPFRAERCIYSAGGCRDGLQRALIEPRLDQVSRGILEEAAALIGRQGDEIAVRRADADRVDLESIFRGRLGRIHRTAFEILPVGHQDHHLVAVRAALQGGLCLLDGARDIGAAARNDPRVERGERLLKRAIVQGDRALQEGAARECDQAHGIPVQLIHEVTDRKLRALQPVGFHVRGRHAAGGVHREDDVIAAAFGLFPAIAGLRLRQRHEQQSHRRRKQRAPRPASSHRDRLRQLLAQVR